MVNLNGIPEAAFEQLKNCTSPEEVLELAQQYDVELTYEEAETAVGKDKEDLPMGFGCNDDTPHECRTCTYEKGMIADDVTCEKNGKVRYRYGCDQWKKYFWLDG